MIFDRIPDTVEIARYSWKFPATNLTLKAKYALKMLRSLTRATLPLATRGMRLTVARASSQYLRKLAAPTASVVHQKRHFEAKFTEPIAPPKQLTFKDVRGRE